MSPDGLGGMIQLGAWAETALGMEVMSIGRSADSKDDCVLELSGRQLFLRVAIRDSWIWVSACGMDEADLPQFLFKIGDGPSGWATVSKFVQALERSGLESLQEPDRGTTFFGEALQQLRARRVLPNQPQSLMRDSALPESREYFAQTCFINPRLLPWAICEREPVGERIGSANQFLDPRQASFDRS